MSISKEDEKFWLDTIRYVKQNTSSQVVTKKQPEIIIKKHSTEIRINENVFYSKNIEDLEAGGIDKSTLKKFKKEEFPIEATLDLHGKTEDEAFVLVDEFIPKCYNLGKRCIVIITGKGLNIHKNEDIFTNKGILRKSVPLWLNTLRLRSMILVYKHPSEKLGGSGALYILLRRNKKLV